MAVDRLLEDVAHADQMATLLMSRVGQCWVMAGPTTSALAPPATIVVIVRTLSPLVALEYRSLASDTGETLNSRKKSA